MITVHHLNNSRSQRVLWLLEEFGVPYEVRRSERDAKTMLAPSALLAVHPPLGKSPVVTDAGVTVAESGAITEYLVDRFGAGRLIPPPLLTRISGRVATAPMQWPFSAMARRISSSVQTAFVDPRLKLPRGSPYAH